MSSNNNSDLWDVLSAMCQQEENGYAVRDYLHQQQQEHQEIEMQIGNGPLNITSVSLHSAASQEAMENRSKMVAWCYRVVDFCKFRRETVAIAVNIVDRYMMATSSPCCPPCAEEDSLAAARRRRNYQLVVMTALYTAVKIHEPEAMDPAMVVTLSRGAYTEKEVEAMEIQLLQAVTWRVNPPTAVAFCRTSLEWMIQESSNTLQPILWSEEIQKTLLDLVQVQVELAVAESDFVTLKASELAYSALVNALMGIGLWDEQQVYTMATSLAKALQIMDPMSSLYHVKVQTWLCEQAFSQQGIGSGGMLFATTRRMTSTTTAPASSPKQLQQTTLQRQDSTDVSPRSISATNYL